jgi:hypothetical protein
MLRTAVWLLTACIAIFVFPYLEQTRIVVAAGMPSQSPLPKDVKYSVRGSSGAHDGAVGAILALEEGKTYKLTGESRQDRETGYFKKIYGCKLIDQGDFDSKRSYDALVLCVGHLFILSARGGGRFSMTGAFAGGFRDQPVVERWKGRWSVVATHDELGFMSIDEDGMGRDETDEPVKERFIFEAGKVVIVDTNHPELKSVVEMRNANLWKEHVKTIE